MPARIIAVETMAIMVKVSVMVFWTANQFRDEFLGFPLCFVPKGAKSAMAFKGSASASFVRSISKHLLNLVHN